MLVTFKANFEILFSEPTFQDGDGIDTDYKTPIFGFKSDILAIYRYFHHLNLYNIHLYLF